MKKKGYIATGLSICMALQLLPVDMQIAKAKEAVSMVYVGSTDGYYAISTADQLEMFSEIVKGDVSEGSDYTVTDQSGSQVSQSLVKSQNVKLQNDITLQSGSFYYCMGDQNAYYTTDETASGIRLTNAASDSKVTSSFAGVETWSPIGDDSHPYEGEFDGNGYAVKGVYINTSGSEQGLFGVASDTSEIKNVTVSHSYVKGNKNVGNVVGKTTGTVSNCQSDGVVKSVGKYAGGIVGYLKDGSVLNCSNGGYVSTESDYAGGIAGYCNNATIKASLNTGEVCAESDFTGGIAGYLNASAQSSDGQITDCSNAGNLFGGNSYVGGITGYSSGTISQSYVTGQIMTGKDAKGSIAGYNDGTITNSYYDKQISTVGGVNGSDTDNASGKLTTELTGDSLKTTWGTSVWSYTSESYPCPSSLAGRENVEAAQIAFPFYQNASDNTVDTVECITQDFELSNTDGYTVKSSDSSILKVNGSKVTIERSTVDGENVSLTVEKNDNVYRMITIAKVVQRHVLTSIGVTQAPDKTDYVEGESFDSEGMVVTAYFGDGTSEEITEYEIAPEELALGTTGVTITYTLGDIVKTAIQPITVTAKSPVGIVIDQEPDKTVYTLGEAFDPEGMSVCLEYDNGDQEEITGYTYPTGVLSLTDETVTISYSLNGTVYEATVDIVVHEEWPSAIELQQGPNQTIYYAGQSFDSEGMVVVAKYQSGFVQDITDEMEYDDEELAYGTTQMVLYYYLDTEEYAVTVPISVIKSKLLSVSSQNATIEVSNGVDKTVDGLQLPSQVDIVTEGDMVTQADVNWNVAAASYNKTLLTEQVFTVSGTLVLPEIIDANNISLNVTRTVKVKKYEKKKPSYKVPSNCSVFYGSKLSDVTLPKGFAWNTPDVSVGNAGKHTFKASYTPTDTARYNVVTNISISVKVKKVSLSDKTVKNKSIKEQTYKGTALKPKEELTFQNQKLKKGVDYKVQYKNNKSGGIGKIIVKGIGNFTGKRTIKFNIYEDYKGYVVTPYALRGRSKASMNSKVVRYLKKGQHFKVLRICKIPRNKYAWYKIKSRGKYCYVFSRYLKKI